MPLVQLHPAGALGHGREYPAQFRKHLIVRGLLDLVEEIHRDVVVERPDVPGTHTAATSGIVPSVYGHAF
jgi:hypothetical protein